MSFPRRQLRLWAARMLFVWLFGVGAGLANACLTALPTETAGGHSTHDTGAAAPHHDGAEKSLGSPANPSCQVFCDGAGVSIPTQKAAIDDLQAYALVPQVVATALPVPVLEPVQLWVPHRDGLRTAPIPLALLRLAL